ncbi:Protein BIG GRAIN 1-like A [Linum perenne]
MDRSSSSTTAHNNPSFSSSLLDSIYTSFDSSASSSTDRHHSMVFYREKKPLPTTRKTPPNLPEDQNHCNYSTNWVENKPTAARKHTQKKKNNYCYGYGGVGGFQFQQRCQNGAFREADYSNSSCSSSDWSRGSRAGFSSSESADDSLPVSRSYLNPIRIGDCQHRDFKKSEGVCGGGGGGRGGFVKKKSIALKNLYGDLKKVKQQPISPGRRLASFLNSLFTPATTTTKQGKISRGGGGGDEIRPTSSSACSSASSFSRSCLSKTPSSRGTAGKRSVRFYPVSVIVDEDSRPCGHKSVYSTDKEEVMAVARINDHAAAAAKEELKYRIMCESRRVEEVARELLKSYNQIQKKKSNTLEEELFFRGDRDEEEEEDDDDEDEGASCASSDLFELDNLSAIEGIERYREELPVYETTHLTKSNHAIANAFFVQ